MARRVRLTFLSGRFQRFANKRNFFYHNDNNSFGHFSRLFSHRPHVVSSVDRRLFFELSKLLGLRNVFKRFCEFTTRDYDKMFNTFRSVCTKLRRNFIRFPRSRTENVSVFKRCVLFALVVSDNHCVFWCFYFTDRLDQFIDFNF